jgi:hypothetical protein
MSAPFLTESRVDGRPCACGALDDPNTSVNSKTSATCFIEHLLLVMAIAPRRLIATP